MNLQLTQIQAVFTLANPDYWGFTACPLLVVCMRLDWTEVALFPPVLPELAAWEHCAHWKNHVNIKGDLGVNVFGLWKHNF